MDPLILSIAMHWMGTWVPTQWQYKSEKIFWPERAAHWHWCVEVVAAGGGLADGGRLCPPRVDQETGRGELRPAGDTGHTAHGLYNHVTTAQIMCLSFPSHHLCNGF